MKPRAKTFHFCGYQIDQVNKKILFNYRLEFSNRDPLEFTETLILPKSSKNLKETSIRKFLEPLHLILGISYYKLYCPPKIKLPFKLSPEQADFWNTVYKKGLGEFFYRNGLNPDKVAKFPRSKIKISSSKINVLDRAMLGIGGGKDSIVAAELLKDFKTTSFLVETQKNDPHTRKIIDEIGNPCLRAQRMLDPKIFEKYEDAYNGHIPISAIFAFIGLLMGALYQFKYVIVANEHSSNFGNLKYRGETINHQWSKSIEFEAMLQDYTKKYITSDIVYFSALRQFHEIRVAQMFAEHKKYFPNFTSCNRNFRVHRKRPSDLWCGECPKCAFAFLIFAPFLAKRDLLNIFKKNLFADDNLVSTYRDLLGFGKLKPFDCVGTFEESQAALYLASKKYKNDLAVKTLLPKIKHPQKLVEKVFKTASALTLPIPFRFLGIKNICILGYGKEGKITEKFIKKKYSHLKIGILDQSLNKNYLKEQQNYDLAIKTPGIPKTKVSIPYVTATNLFFSQNKNFTIGITGTKGKSTTVSLIYQMLKTAGKKVRLLGNIGNPMLEVLLKKVDADEIFVIELSSYMLDDIEYSPNIGVLLNLFPEHMDYHGGVENYYAAKENIFKFQKSGDVAIRSPFKEKILLKNTEIPIPGAHNRKNIQAAIKVAKLLNVSDSAIKKGIKNFKALPHRLEFVGTFKDILFYDDAISTTPESTINAIKTLKKVSTIFLGGEDRGYDFAELEKVLKTSQVKNIVLFPNSGKRILKSKSGFNILETRSMDEAVKFAYKFSPKGTICLLSTASPSYSVWKNFEEKGNLFQKAVKRYSKNIRDK